MSDWPEVEVASASELGDWLAAQPVDAGSHWLIHGKKSAGDAYLPYSVMVEELLAHGWIDSRPRSIDATRTAHLISPRKPGSVWSKDNRERIAKLEREGRLAPRGQALVDAAKRDGSWDRLKETENGVAPPELESALAAGDAMEGWRGFSLAVRRRALEFLLSAKRPATRDKRIAQIVAASAEGVDPTAWKPKRG